MEIVYWHNTLSSGKSVTLRAFTGFRWGLFTIELTFNEREKLLQKNKIILRLQTTVDKTTTNDVNKCYLTDGWEHWTEIDKKNEFTHEENEELVRIIGNEDKNTLIENDWEMSDTFYEITGGFL